VPVFEVTLFEAVKVVVLFLLPDPWEQEFLPQHLMMNFLVPFLFDEKLDLLKPP